MHQAGDGGDSYYLVLRGSGRQPILNHDDDRRRFSRYVAEATTECRAAVHAFCWTPNEARLAVQVSTAPLSDFTQYITDAHDRRLEREISLTGSHFEKKYRGLLIDGRDALLDIVRHIHLAPVKAGLTDDPALYPWSSHRAYLGLDTVPWLTMKAVFASLALHGVDLRTAYGEFMLQGLDSQGGIRSAI